MLYHAWRKFRRTIRNWGNDPTRADRNAVIHRIVTAAAEESKDKASAPLGMSIHRTPTPPPGSSPLAPLSSVPPEPEFPKEVVGQRAFEIWVRNGRPTGTAESDWAQALAELKAEKTQVPAAT